MNNSVFNKSEAGVHRTLIHLIFFSYVNHVAVTLTNFIYTRKAVRFVSKQGQLP